MEGQAGLFWLGGLALAASLGAGPHRQGWTMRGGEVEILGGLTEHKEDDEEVFARPRPVVDAAPVLALVLRLQGGEVQVGGRGRGHKARPPLVGVRNEVARSRV